MPVVSHKNQLPVSERFNFLAMDADGYDLPKDWYISVSRHLFVVTHLALGI